MRRPVWARILCKHSVSEIHPGDAIWCKSQDASLYGAICEVHPVPNNLNQVKKMYEFLKDLLREKQLLSYWWDFAKNTEKDSFRVLIQSMVKLREYQEFWLFSFISRRDCKSCRTDHLFTWLVKQQIQSRTIDSTTFFWMCGFLRR